MSFKPGDPYHTQFTTQRFDTGEACDADETPVAVAARNGVDDDTFSLLVEQVATGRYRVSGTIPEDYAAGDVVHTIVTATVNEVPGTAVIDAFVLDGKRLADLHDFDPAAESVIPGSGLLSQLEAIGAQTSDIKLIAQAGRRP